MDTTTTPLGTKDNPHTVAPADWHANGVEYGAWCRCFICDHVGRSTFVFDFYADKPSDKLKCESCLLYPAATQNN